MANEGLADDLNSMLNMAEDILDSVRPTFTLDAGPVMKTMIEAGLSGRRLGTALSCDFRAGRPGGWTCS